MTKLSVRPRSPEPRAESRPGASLWLLSHFHVLTTYPNDTNHITGLHGYALVVGWWRMKTLAIIAQKGGSGKTTVAVHMAACAAQQKLKTAIIDIDPQRSAFLWNESRAEDRKLDAVAADISQLADLLQQARVPACRTSNYRHCTSFERRCSDRCQACRLCPDTLPPCPLRPGRYSRNP